MRCWEGFEDPIIGISAGKKSSLLHPVYVEA